MKILTPRNNKDYYDYLTGIYGIDEKVVFDRRNFTLLSTVDYPIFNYTPNDHDKPKHERRSWERVGNKCKWVINYEATQQFKCLLEVGLKWYLFEIERYLDKSGNVCIDWKHTKTIQIKKSQRTSSQPITFYKKYWIRDRSLWGRRNSDSEPKDFVEEEDAIYNPILRETPMASLIPPLDIYLDLSTYISSLNDIEVVDTRSDVQKAESAGFDRKTSFRNIK